MKYVAIILVFLLSACAAGVTSLGDNRYVVSKKAMTGTSGVGALRAEALRAASNECGKSDKVANVETETETDPVYLLGNYRKLEITFSCIPAPGN